MKPGLARALPMGIVGFLLGALIVILLRTAQSLDPVWDPQTGFVVAAFVTSAAFVWGMGAFNPVVNQHPHAPEVDEETGLAIVPAEAHHEDEEEPEEKAFNILGYTIWEISFWTILLLVGLAAFATLPFGFFLRTASDPAASTADIGSDTTWQIPFGGPELEVTQLTSFVAFTAFTLLSLAVIGGIIGLIFYILSYGVKEADATPATEFGSEPLPRKDLIRRSISAIIFIVLFLILYVVFYAVLIGLVLPNPEWLRVVLSIANAFIVATLIIYPTPLLRIMGKGAAAVAKILRGVPDAVQ